jgi:hypothetical protein
MIVQNRYPDPFIDFGFNSQFKEVNIGDVITIDQETIYNKDVYSITLIADGASIISQDLNMIVFTLTDSGTFPVTVEVVRGAETRILTSNTLTLKVLTKASSGTILASSGVILASG